MSDQVFVGDVVLPDRVLEGGHVLVSGGIVQHVGMGSPPAGERYGGPGVLVLPGAIDSQVHSRSQKDQEDFIWSTRSAAAGGVTTIIDMPYDDGDLICTAERLSSKREAAEAQARVDFGLYATIDPNDGPGHIDALVAAGAAGFKFSTFGTHPLRFPRITPAMMFDCFRAIAPHGLIAGVHNEDDDVVRTMTERVRQSGDTSPAAHGRARPPVSEALASAQVYELGAATGCAAHIVHSSIARGYEMAASYRSRGYEATIEACIHYLMLDEDDVCRLGGLAKVNPPIRPRDQREALWRHLAVGNVTVVSTDHVSWSLDRKVNADMFQNASGVPGLEVMLPLLLKGLTERDLCLSHAARLLAHNPAHLFRLGMTKGALAVGRDADIVLSTKAKHRYDPSRFSNNVVDWSPYEGFDLPYRIDAVFVRGKPVSIDGRVVAQPGSGRFQRPLSRG
ncbi:MAG: dihydroorotase family protein [Sphingosinicella sp.]|nr:dihydroorotase family protein [Sphingosinicella sp.]